MFIPGKSNVMTAGEVAGTTVSAILAVVLVIVVVVVVVKMHRMNMACFSGMYLPS
jgi:hypothetical protein